MTALATQQQQQQFRVTEDIQSEQAKNVTSCKRQWTTLYVPTSVPSLPTRSGSCTLETLETTKLDCYCPDLSRGMGEEPCQPYGNKNGRTSSTSGCDGDEVGAHLCENRLCDDLEVNSGANPATILLFHESGLGPGTPSGKLGPSNSVANPGTILVSSTGLGTPDLTVTPSGEMGPSLSIMSYQLSCPTSLSNLSNYLVNINGIWPAPKDVTYINFFWSKSIQNQCTSKEIKYLNCLKEPASSNCMTEPASSNFLKEPVSSNFLKEPTSSNFLKEPTSSTQAKPLAVLMKEKEQFEYNVSFLKLLLLIVDGDVEVNPGPTDNNCTPKGRKMKKKNFNFTPKKLHLDNVNDSNQTAVISATMPDNDKKKPISLVNVANDCFFNSVVQALFSLQSFRNHVKNFDSHINDEINAVHSIKQLFSDMEAKSTNIIQTHEYLMSLDLPHYIEHDQFDAEECMTFIINLFYPRINEPGNPRHEWVPDDSIFLLDGEESILCYNCNEQSNSKYISKSN